MITLYGIKNCDTVKKAIKLLDAGKYDWSLHDFREQGLPRPLLDTFLQVFDSEQLINKRSTSWRQLTPGQQQQINNHEALVQILQDYPTLIKRPVVQIGNKDWLIGYAALSDYLSRTA